MFDRDKYVGSEKFEMLKEGLPFGQEFSFTYTNGKGRESMVIAIPLFPKVRYNLGTGEVWEYFAFRIENVKFVDGKGGGGNAKPTADASHDYLVSRIENLAPTTTEKGLKCRKLHKDTMYPQLPSQIDRAALSVKRMRVIKGNEAAENLLNSLKWKSMSPVFLAAPKFVEADKGDVYYR